MATIPENLYKEALFKQEFRKVVEDKNIFSAVATKVVAKAKNILSPFTSVGAAKAYTTPCVVPISALTIGVDELVLDRHIGNAIVDCNEDWTYAKFDINESARGDLYASVMLKENALALADFLADATVVAGEVDLSTKDKVNDFLIKVRQEALGVLGVKQKVDGATIVRSPIHGKPFVAAGPVAYRAIMNQIVSQTTLSTITNGLKDGNIIETPFGVSIIDLSNVTGVNDKQLLYGVAGVPTIGFREDKMEVDMGYLNSVDTYTDESADLDVVTGDKLLTKQYFMSAKTTGRNGIFSNVASLVKKQLMG